MIGRSWSTSLKVKIIGSLITTYGVMIAATGNMDGGSGNNEGLQPYPNRTTSSEDQQSQREVPSPDLSRCIAVSDAKEKSLLFDVCIKYIPTNKLFIYDYGIDYEQLKGDLTLLNAALTTSPLATSYCMDLIRAYTCNYVYPGCSNETGLPQGICKDECQRYVLTDVCKGEFNTLEHVTKATGMLTFQRQCNNSLLLLQDYGLDTENATHSDCINITETITESPPVENTDTANSVTTPTIESKADAPLSDLQLVLPLTSVSVLLLTLLGVVVIVVNIWKARKDKGKSTNPLESLTITNEYSQWLEGNDNNDKLVSQGLFQLSEEDVQSFWKDDKLRNALVSTDNLYITGELGEGAFGRVFKGLLVAEDPSEESGRKITQIAIKTVKNTQGMYRELKAFIEESALMCSFNHPHVLGMVGICLDTVQSPYLLLPYMANGDLRTFLRNKRDTSKSNPSKSSDTGYPEGLEYNILVRLCYEIATGMEYLASKKLVHRDLAARNCMIDQDLSVKVADFGLARVIYHTDYYRQHQQMKVPVKWMAPESLHDMISTEKSDVWSYGVVCWEVFSLGRLPYPTLANHEVVDYLERGNRLKKPALCGDDIYDLLLNCWEDEAEKRPKFKDIVSSYHDGLMRGISMAEHRDGYALLGPEESSTGHQQLTSLTGTLVMDTSNIINEYSKTHTPSAGGTTFDVIFLSPKGAEQQPDVTAIPLDEEYYMEMNSLSQLGGSVLVNQAAVHEYDNVAQEHQEMVGGENGHVTTTTDHVTESPCTHSNEDQKLNASMSDYILMQATDRNITS